MTVKLRIFEKEKEVLSQTLAVGTYVVGRGESCDICLSHQSVSRQHVEIRVTENAVYFSNLSTGQMFVNGELLETAEIASGDSVKIGSYDLIVHTDTNMEEVQEPVFDVTSGGTPQLAPEHREAEEAFDSDDQFADSVDDSPSQAGMSVPNLQEDAFQGTAALNLSDTRVEMKPLVAKLIFTEGPNKGQEFFLETYEITFGRSKKADIFIDDEKLSRLHAKISRIGHGYRLIDLGSRNGTYVNGIRILEHPLGSFDEITFGSSRMKFVIHDMISNLEKGASSTGLKLVEDTKSVQVDPKEQARILAVHKNSQSPPPMPPAMPRNLATPDPQKKFKKAIKLSIFALIIIAVAMALVPQAPPIDPPPPADTVSADSEIEQGTATGAQKAPVGTLPKEWNELSAAQQRRIEGYYTSALRAASQEEYSQSVENLRKIHQYLPYYKDSRALLAKYNKKIKEKVIAEATENAKQREKMDLNIYLEDGLDYLRQGEFEKAADNFRSAISIDPYNKIAQKGLKAADKKVTDLNKVPADESPETLKAKKVEELKELAIHAFQRRSYQEAISYADQILKIELKGQTDYLHDANQIKSIAQNQQKEEFEPFLLQAKEKYSEGDYNTARDICEEMVKRDPAYKPAVKLLAQSKKKLSALAKEAYTYFIILENMNKLDEAIQYLKRGQEYVRPGDPYYEKITKKIELYQ